MTVAHPTEDFASRTQLLTDERKVMENSNERRYHKA